MFLSQLMLNRRSRAVQRDLSDCHQLHRTIMSAFPDATDRARQQFGVLFRVEPSRHGWSLLVLVQSQVHPDWSRLPPDYLARPPAVKNIADAISRVTEGTRLRFRLRANPTRLIRPDDRKHGQRVELRNEADRLAWLSRQGHAGGFSITGATSVTVSPTDRLVGRRNGSIRITVAASTFEGMLEVTDARLFIEMLKSGLGRARAYGCGLLSIARVSHPC